ncbi:MAG: hypothetical protein KF861_12980 [Planctomycetaceae bacterium]|nr:hypothetical protein [Planctomycetaceae bacterium]
MIPETNFFVGRFTDVARDPVGLLTDVFRFLEIVADHRWIVETVGRPSNTTERVGIPPRVRAVLEQLFGDEVCRLRATGLIDEPALIATETAEG